MEAVYQSLAERMISHFASDQAQAKPRLLIALAGPPGSGKSTIAQKVVQQLDATPSAPSALAISIDGFHLPLATLRSLPNASEAIARRGAPWTFDGAAAAALVHELRNAAGKTAVAAPTFDHAGKDPVPGGLTVGPDVQVCILEGNYLLCDEAPWDGISPAVDYRWLVRVEPSLARARVARRHLESGIENTVEMALKRTDENDLVNGEYVVKHSEGRYDVLIESIDETKLG
ncbi:P-loop containing nucleoside triphosphate hydrolase protein [Thelonectria olida]|uniref:P-loop containing nucleoside triphosphate hydrolase protein n=1 Tax=Thelonectria olida TaxID=1576542 RepID=A0A9P8W258_9HYPO|nr:P-loop containing nucleoside triphosphate hydrolase protein [Thelonectria olida]